MSQEPCAMSALEVLQTCPTQQKNFLTALRDLDPEKTTSFLSSWMILQLGSHINFLSSCPQNSLEIPSVILFWTRENPLWSYIFLIGDPLVLLTLNIHP